ncbi:ABC transporter related [Rhodopseudomonas palustris HaA2]|uniref:ABC transporter related n=1 Tax=Rhodopseudomonas palustris (strain HaA2) TaxID=316058 RepID=Q2IVE3_RHOP2|nr:ABC transporter ATP-binding protein [Rhodopseudomonas palustris]ABD07817.1 ABC transporter related [Rhodopseudomonas palustris HaA2]
MNIAVAPPPHTTPYLEVDNLSKVYASDDGPVRALDRVSLQQRRGEFVSIVGPSGCGKSTLLMIAAGLASRSEGRVLVDDKLVDGPRTDLGIVFQNHVLLEWRTALQNVMLQAVARKMDMKVAEKRARELLAAVGLGGFENKYPGSLSGGMKQRVSICRALIHDPPHLLMDEPFGALDSLTRDQLVLDLQRICSERSTAVLFITHSIAEAVFLSDRVVVMTPRPGKIDRIIDIDLPRPRTLAMRESAEFARYSHEILKVFLARGVIKE